MPVQYVGYKHTGDQKNPHDRENFHKLRRVRATGGVLANG